MPSALLLAAFDPEHFERHGKHVIERMRGYFEDARAGTDRTLPWTSPETLVREADARLAVPGSAFDELLRDAIARMHRLHSPRYMGHQVPPPIPAAGLFEGMALLANQSGAIFEMSPFCSAAEQAVIGRLGEKLGWTRGTFAGIGTHGGSLANLTAILAARNVTYPGAWEHGVPRGEGAPAVLVSGGAHYSIARAAGIAGLGTANVVKVPVDDRHHMRAEAVERTLAESRARGQAPFCLVASSCSTSVGAFDPLEELAEVARRHRLWLHVDGAHGASVRFSAKYRHYVTGIEAADTVTWDAHKMLFMPSLSTFLFYRREADSWEAFAQEAPYLFDPRAPGLGAFDGALRTLECTKRSLATGLWAVWALYGESLFGELVDICFDRARELHGLLVDTPDFEPLHAPEANILCFRYVPAGWADAPPEKIDELQQRLRRAVVEEGPQYLTGTRVQGRAALRVTLINPFTERTHLEELVVRLRELSGPIAGSLSGRGSTSSRASAT